MEIQFGALAPPLHKQLNLPPARLKLLQRQADSITVLAVASLLSNAEAHRVRLRLMKRIARFADPTPERKA